MFAKVRKGKVFRIWRRGEGHFHYPWSVGVWCQTSVRGGQASRVRLVMGQETIEIVQKVSEAGFRDVRPIEVVKRLWFWRRRLERIIGDVCRRCGPCGDGWYRKMIDWFREGGLVRMDVRMSWGGGIVEYRCNNSRCIF